MTGPDSVEPSPRPLLRLDRRWIEAAVAAASLAGLLALTLPAILTARTAARREQSANNLRNLVIAVFTHATNGNGRLPAGARVKPDGTATGGWFLHLYPYVESGPLYQSVVEHDVAWDDPVVREPLTQSFSLVQNPLISQRVTLDGWPLIHYSANPDLLYQNNKTRMEDVEGLSDCWIFGEVSDHFVPWAYPFNWREPGDSVAGEASAFRSPSGPCQFAMLDGRVAQVSPSGSKVFLKRSARSTERERTRCQRETPWARLVPARTFATTP